MITIEPVIRNFRSNGFAQVYIRIIQKTKPAYIPTAFTATPNQIKDKKLIDYQLIVKIAPKIESYYNKLNQVNTDNWTVQEVVSYLTSDSSEISFTDFCTEYINDMICNDRENPASNYRVAINNLKKFSKEELYFSDITSKLINDWIKSLSKTTTAKNSYPSCISTMFSAGQTKYNNYDKNIIRIPNRPFKAVTIPPKEKALKRAISRLSLLRLLTADTTNAKMVINTPRAKDVALLIIHLAGINVADLYYMEKDCLVGKNKLSYIRWKTKDKRKEDGRMIITIHPRILPLFKKYKGKKRLFCFSEDINSEKNFLKQVDMGLKELAFIAQVDENISTYVFRHSVGTIAQNHCVASTELVAFLLNHASGHKVTEGYIKKDYSQIDIINQKVINWIYYRKRLIKKKFKYNKKTK